MKRTELTSKLQRIYRPELDCGIEKIPEMGLENIWFVVPPPPPRALPKGLPVKALSKATRLITELSNSHAANELDQLVMHLLTRREAVQSSRIEGTWSTLDHVLTPGEVYDQGESKTERASVLGYAHALESEFQVISSQGPEALTSELVCRIHKKIMSKDPHYRGIAGQFRKSIVLIGGLNHREESIYNPTPPRHIKRCLQEVLNWMSDIELVELGDAGMGMPLPVRMAIGHSHFEAVHPFSDGNGRIGRVLMALQMVAHRILPLYLSGFIEVEKKAYISSLEEAQKKLKYGPIVEFISEAIVASHQEANETKRAIEGLPALWLQRNSFRTGSAALLMLKSIITNPIFTAKQMKNVLKLSKPAVNHAIQQLQKAKILRERTGSTRYRLFAAEEVLELISRPFGENPSIALSKARDLLDGPLEN